MTNKYTLENIKEILKDLEEIENIEETDNDYFTIDLEPLRNDERFWINILLNNDFVQLETYRKEKGCELIEVGNFNVQENFKRNGFFNTYKRLYKKSNPNIKELVLDTIELYSLNISDYKDIPDEYYEDIPLF